MEWDDDKILAFDFETSGSKPEYALQPWRVATGEAWVTSLAAAHKTPHGMTWQGGIAAPYTPDVIRPMCKAFLEQALDTKSRIVGWNVQFDIQWLLAYGFETEVMRLQWLDGMLLWRHWFIEPEYEMERHKKKSYGLKLAVTEEFPQFAGYEEDVDFHDPSPEARTTLHQYNQRDTLFTLRLAKRYYHKLLRSSPQRLTAALIEAQCLPQIAQANLSGMVVDTLAARELSAYLVATAKKAVAVLEPHGVTEQIIRSPVKLATLLYDDWGLPVIKESTGKKTGKVSRSTDKEALHELSILDERVPVLRVYRAALNNKTKFAEAPLKSVAYNEDGRTHPHAHVFGTYSGRLTYSSKQGKNKDERQTGFALHQEKRGAEFRNIIVPPPGYTLVEFDAAGQEFRWMAIASRDPTMLDLCAPGEDPHTYMGSRIANREYREMMAAYAAGEAAAKSSRQNGKVSNLCMAAGTKVLTDRGVCSIEDVRRDDRVWDGLAFVAHEGVVCSGYRPVITYDGLTATPDHRVLVDGRWISLADAARYAGRIESALGARWPDRARSGVRIVDGCVRRALSEAWGVVRDRLVSVWSRARDEFADAGNWPFETVQGLHDTPAARAYRSPPGENRDRSHTAETGQRMVSAMPQPEGSLVSQLRRAWDSVSVRVGTRRGRMDQETSPTSDVSPTRRRSNRQRWALRSWQLALGYTPRESREPASAWVYDLVNCGPRHRFVANGRIVHNSLQYRTSWRKLRKVARVDYGLHMTEHESQYIRQTYLNTYLKVPQYWNEQITLTKQRGWVETFAGRRVQVVGNWGGEFGWSMGSTAINYRIQGTGADQKYLAMAVLRPFLRKHGIRFAWDLHDGIYFYVPDALVEMAVPIMRQMLLTLPYQKAWGFTPPITLPWDCKVGKSWGSLHEVKAA